MKATVNYALPTADFNPYADFYIGCTTKYLPNGSPVGDHAWTTKGRLYRILTSTRWDYASFNDPYHSLAKNDVPSFEVIARKLLAESLPAAHNCALPGKGKSTPVPSKYWWITATANVTSNGLTIAARPASPLLTGAAIVTKSVLTGKASDVTQLEFPDFTMTVTAPATPAVCAGSCLQGLSATCKAQGASTDDALDTCIDAALAALGAPSLEAPSPTPTQLTVTFHVYGSALAFKATSTVTTLEVPVKVTSSSYTPCKSGDTGTMTLTEAASDSITIDACGSANLLKPDPGTTPNFTTTFAAAG